MLQLGSCCHSPIMAGFSALSCVGTTLGAPLKTEKTAKYEYHYTKNRKRVKFFDIFSTVFLS